MRFQNIEFTIAYTDGTIKKKLFNSKEEGRRWIHNEGDHVLDFSYKIV